MCIILKTARLTVSISSPCLSVSVCLDVFTLKSWWDLSFFNTSVIGPCDYSEALTSQAC